MVTDSFGAANAKRGEEASNAAVEVRPRRAARREMGVEGVMRLAGKFSAGMMQGAFPWTQRRRVAEDAEEDSARHWGSPLGFAEEAETPANWHVLAD